MKRRLILTIVNFSLLLAFLALEPLRCGTRLPELPAAQFPPAIIIVEGKTAQGFSYLSGGVGSDEREVMEVRGKSYNLKLIFAEKSGAYLANVRLVIADAQGKEIIALTTNGPWFYAQLPSAKYSITATFDGQTRMINSLNLAKDKFVRQVLLW